MRSLFLVPFRSGSKGISRKNLRKINGISLAARAIQFGLSAESVGPTLISTDSYQMLNSVLGEIGMSRVGKLEPGYVIAVSPGLLVHYRKAELARDESPLGPVIAECMQQVDQLGLGITHLVLLQPTSPFRSSADLAKIISLIANMGPDESAVSVVRVDDAHPARMYVSRKLQSGEEVLVRLPGFDSHEFSPRQRLPEVYLRDGAFYILGSDLARLGLQLGQSPQFLERFWPYTINVDTLPDLEEARKIGKKSKL